MTVFYPLHVLLIVVILSTSTFATFRDSKDAIDEFGQVYIRSVSESPGSLEEGEIGYSSDGLAVELEEGEIGDDYEMGSTYPPLVYRQQQHHYSQPQSGLVGASGHATQEKDPWCPSEEWTETQEEDLEEGEIRDLPDLEAWREGYEEDFDLDTMSSDGGEEGTMPSDAESHRRESTDEFDSSKIVTDFEKKSSLINDILNRPALPRISTMHHSRSSPNDASQSNLSQSKASASNARVLSSAGSTSTTSSIRTTPVHRSHDDIFSFIANDQSLTTRMRQQRQRATFGRIWREKGISYDLGFQEVALKVAELKIEYGHDVTLGTMASIKVQKETNEEYFHQFQLATRNYSRKLCDEKNKLKMEPKYYHLSELQKKRFLCKQIAKYQPRLYTERKIKDVKSMQNVIRLNQSAKEAWNEFMDILRDRLEYPELQEEELSIEYIEEQSRNLCLAGANKNTTVELLKRYMVQCMGIKENQLQQFSINRLRYQYQVHKERKLEKKRREGRSDV